MRRYLASITRIVVVVVFVIGGLLPVIPVQASGEILYWTGEFNDVWNYFEYDGISDFNTNWSLSSGGSTSHILPDTTAEVIFDENSFASPGNVTISSPPLSPANWCRDIDFSGIDENVTFLRDNTYPISLLVYGNVTSSNLVTFAGSAGYFDLQMVSNSTATYLGNWADASSLRLTIDKHDATYSYNGTVELLDDTTVRDLVIEWGTLYTTGKVITCIDGLSTFSSPYHGVIDVEDSSLLVGKSIDLADNSWIDDTGASILCQSNSPNRTPGSSCDYYFGTNTIGYSTWGGIIVETNNNGVVTLGIPGDTLTTSYLQIEGVSNTTVWMQGHFIIDSFGIDRSMANKVLSFHDGAVVDVGTELVIPTDGTNTVTMDSSYYNGAWYLNQASGNNTYDYLTLMYSNAGGGATWNAVNSVDEGENTGWNFSITLPAITTDSATNITSTGATLNGNLTSLGDFTPVRVYFDYGTTTSYGSSTTKITEIAPTTFNSTVPLTVGTVYHYRAVAEYNTSDRVNGSDMTFAYYTTTSFPLVEVMGVNVFRGYLETGDTLFCIEYINNQAPYAPTKDPNIYFSMQLLSVDGTTILAATPLPSWGDKPTSIYLSSASSTAITYGASYIIRMIGTYATLPSATYTLTPNDWKGTSMMFLDNWVIDTAWSMNAYDARTLTDSYVVSQGGVDKLTVAVESAFIKGIPYLKEKRPGKFVSAGSTTNNLFGGTPNNSFDTSKNWIVEVGPDVAADMTVFGNLFGLTGKDFNGYLILGIIVLVFGLLISSGVVIVSGLLIAALMLGIGAQFRAIDIQWLVVPAVACVLFFTIQFFFDRR